MCSGALGSGGTATVCGEPTFPLGPRPPSRVNLARSARRTLEWRLLDLARMRPIRECLAPLALVAAVSGCAPPGGPVDPAAGCQSGKCDGVEGPRYCQAVLVGSERRVIARHAQS